MNNININNTKAYFRDKLVPFNQANLSIASSPVLYGLSIYTVFNVSLTADGKLAIFRLKDHFERLTKSARIMDFDKFEKSWNYSKFLKIVTELLNANDIQEDVLVRISVFIDEIAAGTKIHGLTNSLSAYVYPLGQILPAKGVNLGVSSWVRNMDNSIPAKAKINGSYVNASLMKNEALMNGYDDAIALDHNGHVTESTVANLFIVRDGVLATPDTSTDILEGITRDSIIKIAKDEGITVEERSIDRTELYKSDEAFLCGSSARIIPILTVDRRPLGSSRLGPITEKLQKIYLKVINGQSKKHQPWLTFL